MFNSSYKIATVFGIPIKLLFSVIVLVLIYLFDFPFPYCLLIGLGILLSIALHELGHSLVAISKKCKVREITLMFMGGVAQMESIPRKPFDELLMAIAGPAVSLALGLSCLKFGWMIPLPAIPGMNWNVLSFVGVINISLAIFNMIPAFPMDGGRVLRASLTPFIGRLKATKIASIVGKVAAVGFVIWGIRNHELVLVAIALFIYFAAGQEYRYVLMQERGRQFGFWEWMNAASKRNSTAETPEDDEVIISPPPFDNGPSSRSRISEDREDPFQHLRPQG